MKKFKIKCLNCNITYIATDGRHTMYHCPKCRITGVDIEEHYSRYIGYTIFVEEFLPPWFNDESEYQSCLLSWLNDSDEEWTLFKIGDILYMEKIK